VTGPVRRAAAAWLCGLLAVTTSACSGAEDASAPTVRESASPSPTVVPSATPTARPAPVRVRVTRVAGRMRPQDREVLAKNVGSVVAAYFDDAFLGGDYPRSDFDGAFSTFSAGAAARAEKDRDLLTNRELGPTTESVLARRQTAYLSVLAPHKVAAGVTARVDLRFVAERGEEADQEVVVKGRLMLTRKEGGGWTIFGYDLTRSTSPAEAGS
jgi:hypothetical protein